MSISLSSLNTRVTNLEKGSQLIESNLNMPGYVKFANGLIINFGQAGTSKSLFAKAFTTQVFGYSNARINGSEGAFSPNEGRVLCDLTGIWSTSKRSPLVSYIAIGILYTNRVLSSMFKEVVSWLSL